ncbi:MAG TPA: SAM-dependent methyltransferase [Opitutales bacterium]|nr:SAM-dependent methyltransferase [Opitutales bacterium]
MSSAIQKIGEIIAANRAPISFADFVDFALYDPEFGYYKRPRKRIGFDRETDFYTATSTGEVFAELVVAAAEKLLKPDLPGDFTFLEIGAEPNSGILPAKHIFAESKVIRHGESIEFPEKTVFFSNELFDAQPFHRLVFSKNKWREIGIDWRNELVEVELAELSKPVAAIADRLPKSIAEGYHLDLPIASADLLRKFTSASNWQGLLILFDYGKSWREMIEATPQGTARAYHRHRQSNDLLAMPGEQDLTCHICWDWLIEVLEKSGFREIKLQSQEAFFITEATSAIEKIISEKPGEFDRRRQTIQQLIHPGQMGQKFQVLTARR